MWLRSFAAPLFGEAQQRNVAASQYVGNVVSGSARSKFGNASGEFVDLRV